MNKWLTEFFKDMRFLARKSRRMMKVLFKKTGFQIVTAGQNNIATKNGKAAHHSDPLTAETLLTGEPAHYIGQNRRRMNNRFSSMGMGQSRRG